MHSSIASTILNKALFFTLISKIIKIDSVLDQPIQERF